MNDMDTLMEAGRLRNQLEASITHAKEILANLNSRHYPDNPIEPATTLGGLLSQIDSITHGLEKKGRAA